jgi:Resolvase, N terminal domain
MEQVSSVAQREQLEGAMGYVRDGDTFTVTKPDRLARSVGDLPEIVARLEAKNSRSGCWRCPTASPSTGARQGGFLNGQTELPPVGGSWCGIESAKRFRVGAAAISATVETPMLIQKSRKELLSSVAFGHSPTCKHRTFLRSSACRRRHFYLRTPDDLWSTVTDMRPFRASCGMRSA